MGEQTFPAYRPIDLETWPRRQHYPYYKEGLKCGYSITVRADVTALAAYARRSGRRFYGCFLYAAAKAVNGLEAMKMMITPEGGPGVWETVHPNFTVFHEDDGTFTDLWTEYRPDFEDFYREWERVRQTYGSVHGVKGRPGQPANFFCVSCVPWLDFTGFSTQSPGEPAPFPIITYGKYTRAGERLTLPVALTIAHASADGYHASLFFKHLQEALDDFDTMA